jgi:cyclohexa-1,5-dienecarbonyl-CoA hydratase
MSSSVLLERQARVARLTLDRPPLNILDLETIAALDAHLAALAGDGDLQVLIVQGAGEKAFSAGVSVQDHVPDKIEAMLTGFHRALTRLRQHPAVTIAAVRGHCLGGGMELAAVCDLVVAEDGARFGQPEIRLGCYPPVAAALYPTRLGRGAAFDLLLTGRTLDCAAAERLGFVTRRAPAGGLEAAVDRLVGEITAASAAVVRLTKRALRAGEERPFGEALAEGERLYLEELAATADMAEGIAAFLEKRPPEWKHR